MSKENLNKFVNSLEKGDNLKAADAFKASIADKVSSALNDRKVEVGRSMFTSQLGVKVPEADVFSGADADTNTVPIEAPSDEVAQ